MNRAFPVPKGRHVIAQGNALGMRPTKSPSPERAARLAGARAVAPDMFRPFRAGIHSDRNPRALPRAVTLRPVGADSTANENQSRTLAALRDTLLPKLLSGELRLPAALLAAQAGVADLEPRMEPIG